MQADYSRVAEAIAFLEQNLTRQPNLSDLSAGDRVRKLREWMTALDIYPEASLTLV